MDTITRHPERGRSERSDLFELLDEATFGILATVADGLPWVVPLLFACDGDRVLVHGSTGAGALRHVAAGAPVAFSVTLLDGLVVAHSTFESSANYRSAVIRGRLVPLTGDEQWQALDHFADQVIPGRVAEVQPMTRKETAATLAMALPIIDGQWTVKIRRGMPGVPEEPTDAWCGVVPMRTAYGPAQPAPWTAGDQPVPASVLGLIGQARS